MPEVDLAIGSADKERTAELVAEAIGATAETSGARAETPFRFAGTLPAASQGETVGGATASSSYANLQGTVGREPRTRGTVGREPRTRAFLKAQDGCDRFCAYCIIPYARGALKSKPAEQVLREAENLLRAGYKELVLTGINLALYGRDLQGGGLYELVRDITRINTGGEFRVRLGSLEPTVITANDAIRLASLKGVCPQFHLSLQSGCEKTLKAMGRPYTPDDYEGIVAGLRRIDPLFSVTTDVIVGFPGETDADFENSLAFVKRMAFARVHVFKYSKRQGTKAAEMDCQVPEEIKNFRSKAMMEAAEKSASDFVEKNAGSVRRTLILGTAKKGTYVCGITDNGIDVTFPAKSCGSRQNEFCDFPI